MARFQPLVEEILAAVHFVEAGETSALTPVSLRQFEARVRVEYQYNSELCPHDELVSGGIP